MDNIIESHEGYAKIIYPKKRVIILHRLAQNARDFSHERNAPFFCLLWLIHCIFSNHSIIIVLVKGYAICSRH